MFDILFIIYVVLAAWTLVSEFRRAGGITLIWLLTIGNFFYGVLTLAISYYAPGSAVVFQTYVTDAGLVVDEEGIAGAMLAATLFQLACLIVVLGGPKRSNVPAVGGETGAEYVVAAIRMGWLLVAVGMAGAIWLGLVSNGHVLGLYEISYAERSPLFREHSVQAFLLLLGMYGASLLVTAYLMAGRVRAAAFVLLLVTLHGVGIKSKFPIFWVFLVFAVVAIGEKVRISRLVIPASIAVSALLTMSVLRGVSHLSELPEYVARYQDELGGVAFRFWENDIPGPASITYFVINSPSTEHTVEPLLEIFKLLIPKSFYDRGPVVSDLWAAKMMGDAYEPGLGFGWSLLCDGYLVAAWLGVALVSYGVARLARYFVDRKMIGAAGRLPLYSIMAYTSSPLFFYGVRESTAGLVKAVLIMGVLLWLPVLIVGMGRRVSVAPEGA
jgi:hypothetical protein